MRGLRFSERDMAVDKTFDELVASHDDALARAVKMLPDPAKWRGEPRYHIFIPVDDICILEKSESIPASPTDGCLWFEFEMSLDWKSWKLHSRWTERSSKIVTKKQETW